MAIQPVGPAGSPPAAAPAPTERGQGFAAALQQALQPLRLSAHAAQRLRQAGISLDEATLSRANAAVAAAAAKGSQTALVLVHSLAFVVSVPTRTVVTVIDGARMGQGVFTGIDSAVIARGLDPGASAARDGVGHA
jgi:flagellar operon protein